MCHGVRLVDRAIPAFFTADVQTKGSRCIEENDLYQPAQL
jgi:hypothetical protein